jgi:hypothetical protein
MITIDAIKMRKVVDTFINCKEELDIKILNIEEIIDNITVAWNGADETKLVAVLQEKYVMGLKDLSNCLEEYTKYIDATVDAFDLLDDTFASKKIEV